MKVVIQYKKGYKYKLAKAYSIKTPIIPEKAFDNGYVALRKDGTLIINKGYAWDGPSGPAMDTKSFMRGSLVHDALYQLLREKVLGQEYRRVADDLMYVICRRDGMWPLRALWCLWAVRRFAKKASIVGRKVLSAP